MLQLRKTILKIISTKSAIGANGHTGHSDVFAFDFKFNYATNITILTKTVVGRWKIQSRNK